MQQVSKLYVGNLDFNTTEDELRSHFEAKEIQTKTITLIKDKYTNRSKGFGFVEMPNQAEAEEAIKQINGTSVKGRNVTVNQARPRTERPKRPQW